MTSPGKIGAGEFHLRHRPRGFSKTPTSGAVIAKETSEKEGRGKKFWGRGGSKNCLSGDKKRIRRYKE